MNIVGLPPLYSGFTIRGAPTELNAFTKCAAGNSRCSRSISESSSVVKEPQNAIHRRRVRNRIAGVHHQLPVQIRASSCAQNIRRSRALHGQHHDLAKCRRVAEVANAAPLGSCCATRPALPCRACPSWSVTVLDEIRRPAFEPPCPNQELRPSCAFLLSISQRTSTGLIADWVRHAFPCADKPAPRPSVPSSSGTRTMASFPCPTSESARLPRRSPGPRPAMPCG